MSTPAQESLALTAAQKHITDNTTLFQVLQALMQHCWRHLHSGSRGIEGPRQKHIMEYSTMFHQSTTLTQ